MVLQEYTVFPFKMLAYKCSILINMSFHMYLYKSKSLQCLCFYREKILLHSV